MKKRYLVIIFIIFFFTSGEIYAQNKIKSSNISYNGGTVEDFLDSIENSMLNTNVISTSCTHDGSKATVTYTAEKDITLLAIGIGTSTRYNGDSNATLTTTGTATTLVNGEKTVVSGSTCYSKKYAYKVVLKSGDTIKLEVWSNQGNTSNEAILISF